MAHNAAPLISLVVPSKAQTRPISFGSAALSLAAEFNRELVRSENDADKAKVCRAYRDTIMKISMWADDIAAAFTDAFGPYLHKSQRGHDDEAWKSFAVLAQRSRQTSKNDAQKIRHQTTVVAIWGADIFNHYGWHELSLDNIRLLRSVACAQRDWKLAVSLINSVMLERHEGRVIKNDNRLPLIGEHPHGSKMKDCRSPVQRRDITAVIQRLHENNGEVDREGLPYGRIHTIAGTPIQAYGLETDEYGMVVPRQRPGIARDISSPSSRASKRRKLRDARPEDSRRYGSSPTVLIPPQLSSTSVSTPVSELTQFEEESCNFADGSNQEIYSREPPTNKDSACDSIPTDVVTPSIPTNDDIAGDMLHETYCGGPSHTRCKSLSPLRTTSTDDSVRMPGYTEQDIDVAPLQPDAMTQDLMEKGGECFIVDQSPKRPQTAQSWHAKCYLNSSRVMVEIDRQDICNVAGQSQKGPHVSYPRLGLLPPEATKSSPQVHNADVEHDADEAYGEARLESCPCDADTDPSRYGRSRKETQMGNESVTELCTSGDSAALEEAARIGTSIKSPLPKTQSGENRTLQHRLPQQANDGVAAIAETPLSLNSRERFIYTPEEAPLHPYCTNTNVNNDGTIVSRMASSYSSRLRDLLHLAQKNSKNCGTEEHNKLKVAWLERTRWANTHEVPEDVDPTSSLPLDADIWYMAWKTFQQRAQAGEIFKKPVVIKQKFQDSDMYEPQGYMSALKDKFAGQQLDVQNSETGECRKMDVKDFCAVRSNTTQVDYEMLAATSNAINLRKIANADAPLLTRMSRFRLLETLTERAANIGPGKRISSQVNDVSDCLGFDLLGFEGAFTRPHVDALVGTWVRCLSGEKAWVFTPGMDMKDWEDFARDGPSWCPANKGRMIILEKDDVLLMPPGVKTLHTVFTLGPSLMEGGMLWDECNIPAILEGLLWVALNQSCTNEAIAYQLPSIMDTLEIWAEEHGERVSTLVKNASYVQTIKEGVRELRDLGCKCISGCTKSRDCLCINQRRRCSAWCFKHPTLPGPAKSHVRQCMYDA